MACWTTRGADTVRIVQRSDEPIDDGPPEDPEAWTDEQWLSWLRATDASGERDVDDTPPTLTERAANSAVGAVLGQAMLGLARAIYGRAEQDLVIVADGEGPLGDDEPFTVHLDFEHPERSSVAFVAPRDPPESPSP